MGVGLAALGLSAVAGPGAVAQSGYPTPPSGPPGASSPSPSSSGTSGDVVLIRAEGNALYDSADLRFDPASAGAQVGQTVRWLNTDTLVPHTATEDHGLWDLGGTYGATPANPPGFGPGTTVERPFEAGTAHYYCRVHPAQMHGLIAVPVALSIERPATRPAGPALGSAPAHLRRPHRRARAPRRGRRGRRRGRRHRPAKHRPAKRRPTPRPPASSTPTPVVSSTVVAQWASAAPAAGEAFDVQRRRPGGTWEPWLTATTETRGTFAGGAPGTAWEVRARLRRLSDDTQATDWSPTATVTA